MRNFLHLIILCVMLILVTTGCQDLFGDKSNTERGELTNVSGEGYSIEYKFAEGVVFVDNTNEHEIKRVEADSILYLAAGSSLDEQIKEGTVISAEVSERLPYGLGNKVISITEIEGMRRCVTTVAPMDELFEDLKLDAVVPLIHEVPKTMTDDYGKTFETDVVELDDAMEESDSNTRVSLGSRKTLAIKLGYNLNKSGGYYSGTLYVGSILTANIDIKAKKWEVSLEPFAGVAADMGVRGKVNFLKDKDIKIFKKNIVTGICQFGPLTLRPYVDIDVKCDMSAQGEAQIEYHKFGSVKMGWCDKGSILKNTTKDNGNERSIRNLQINGSFDVAFKTGFKMGIGLYTRNIAVGIEPMIKIKPSVECNLFDENAWRFDPKLNIDITLTGEAYVYIQIFGKELWSEQTDFVNFYLWSGNFPLFPGLVDGSFEIDKKDPSQNLIFEGEYTLSGGLLAKVLNFSPGVRIYRAGDLVKDIPSSTVVNILDRYNHKFSVDGLEHDVPYTCRPTLTINLLGKTSIFEYDGTVFSSITPTAAITDIVQTGTIRSTEDEKIIGPNGMSYEYAFTYYVNSEIKGADLCAEWGFYNPDVLLEHELYVPNTLKDGRVTQYWTYYTYDTENITSHTPYAILTDNLGSIKYYETYYKSLGLGRMGTISKDMKNLVQYLPSNSYRQLDSVAYTPKGGVRKIIMRR